MSVINQALSQLVAKQPKTLVGIEAAKVAPVKQRPVWVWLLAGFSISLAVGGWAVSKQATVIDSELSSYHRPAFSAQEQNFNASHTSRSPTQNTQLLTVPVYRVAARESQAKTELLADNMSSPSHSISSPVNDSNTLAKSQPKSVTEPEPQINQSAIAVSHMSIEAVQLTPEQLAAKAVARAERALTQNDFNQAVARYTEALRYTPLDESIRQQLAALYYGKGEIRQAFDLLQRGMQLNYEGETLRLAIARMLLKEEQHQAALTPLSYLPTNPSLEYLSLRAAIAQRNRVDDIALQSYQLLTEKEPNHGRWWLGLAIAQERTSQSRDARYSYQQALNHVGLSSQSHAFIRERLQALSDSEEKPLAN